MSLKVYGIVLRSESNIEKEFFCIFFIENTVALKKITVGVFPKLPTVYEKKNLKFKR